MIVDAIIWLVAAILSPIFDLLPTGSMPFLSNPDLDLATSMGRKMAVVNTFLPVHEGLVVAKVVVGVVLPAVGVYKLANWLYKHIPHIGGFGPGSG